MAASLAPTRLAVVIVLLTAACSGAGVRTTRGSPGTPGSRPLFDPTKPMSGPAGTDQIETPDRMNTRTSSDARRVCRGTSMPSGWIAVAYETATEGECPARGDGTPRRVAVIVRYGDYPVGATLDVCADQPLPRRWEIVRDEHVDGGACPGAAKDGASAMKRILRRR
jgi:hypothetical protein